MSELSESNKKCTLHSPQTAIWFRKTGKHQLVTKSVNGASWGCTDLGIQFRKYQIRTCRNDTVEISKLSSFQKLNKNLRRMHLWPKGFAIEQFSNVKFSPLSFDHIICKHIKSEAILVCRNQIRFSHTPTVFISPIENIWFHGRDQEACTTSNLRWLKLICMSTYTFGWIRAVAVSQSIAIVARPRPWHFQSTGLFPGQGK